MNNNLQYVSLIADCFSVASVWNVALNDVMRAEQVGRSIHKPYEIVVRDTTCGGIINFSQICVMVILQTKILTFRGGITLFDWMMETLTPTNSSIHAACADLIWKNLQNYFLSFCWTLASPRFCCVNLCTLWGREDFTTSRAIVSLSLDITKLIIHLEFSLFTLILFFIVDNAGPNVGLIVALFKLEQCITTPEYCVHPIIEYC